MKRIIAPFLGGGIRGCLIACGLVELEKQTGKLARNSFDMVAGTSTGALIAAAVAAGLPATQVLEIYQKRAKEIFNHGALKLPLQIARGYAFDPANIRRVLEDEFGASKMSWTMNDCPIKVLITAVGMNGHPWFFVNANPMNSRITGGCSLIDAAVASAAAPFYFDHAIVDVAHYGTIRLFDGGAGGLANPTYQAAVEALEYDNYDPTNTRIVTFGTGYFPAPDVPPDGLLQVIEWTMDTLVDSSVDAVDAAVRRQWPGIARKINWTLPRPITMASVDDIPELVALGQREAAKMDWSAILA